MRFYSFTALVLIIACGALSTAFPQQLSQRNSDRRATLLSMLLKSTVRSDVDNPETGIKVREAENGTVLSSLQTTCSEDGDSWEDAGLEEFTFDEDGRLVGVIRTRTMDELVQKNTVQYEYDDSRGVVRKIDEQIDSSAGSVYRMRTESDYYLGIATTYNSYLPYSYGMNAINLNNEEVDAIDSIVITTSRWDDAAGDWNLASKTKTGFSSFSGDCDTTIITHEDCNDDGSTTLFMRERNVAFFNQNGRLDSVICYDAQGLDEFSEYQRILHTYTDDRLSSVSVLHTIEPPVTKDVIDIVYTDEGLVDYYMFSYIFVMYKENVDPDTTMTQQKITFNYKEVTGTYLRKATNGTCSGAVAVSMNKNRVSVTSAKEMEVRSLTILDFAGRVLHRQRVADKKATYVLSLPGTMGTGRYLLTVETERSVITVPLHAVVP